MLFLSLIFLMNSSNETIGPINLTEKASIVDQDGVQAAAGSLGLPTPDKTPRTGAWIWRKDDGKPPVPTRFRKTFSVDDRPKTVTLFASADVSYRLWINGHLVARGPADVGRDYDSGAPGPWLDDVRTVTRFLKAGKNIICAEVFPHTLVASESSTGHPGLKVDLRIQFPTRSVSVVSDKTWKSLPAADLTAYQGENGFTVDANLEPLGWQSEKFDDSAWDPCVLDIHRRPPTLISELAPPLEAVVPAIGVERVSDGVRVQGNLVTFTADGSYAIKYPRVLSARIAIRINGHKGSRLLIMPNEENKPGFNRRAEIVLREGLQTVELPYFDSFSTINIEAKGVAQPISVEEVTAIFTSYPVMYRGSFECDDQELNEKWKVCRWVTQICMQTHHLDSPHHQEPISDAGDYLIEALNNYYAFGEKALARQDLRKIARTLEQRKFQSFHTSYSLLWLHMLTQYWDYTGDASLVRELSEPVHKLMDRFETYLGKNGLVSNAPNYMFMDWVEIEGFNLHHPPAVIGQGYMTAFFYRALADAKRVALLKGDTGRAQHYNALRERIKEAFDRELWDESNGLYRDGKPHVTTIEPNQWLPADKDIETHSTQGNTLAVWSGLAGPERALLVMKKILAREDMNCQPYFMHFVFEALSISGLFEKHVISQLNRWKILPDTHSFLEMWNYGDRSHAWNATPLFQLSGRILGVEPISPGFKSFSIKPHPSGLKWAKGTVPTPRGDIEVEWKADDQGIKIHFSVPPDAVADCAGQKYASGSHDVFVPNQL